MKPFSLFDKGQRGHAFSFQSQRKAMPENAETTYNRAHFTRWQGNADAVGALRACSCSN